MMLFYVVCMVDFIVCSNCGLSYSTSVNDSCSHCKFNIHARKDNKEEYE